MHFRSGTTSCPSRHTDIPYDGLAFEESAIIEPREQATNSLAELGKNLPPHPLTPKPAPPKPSSIVPVFAWLGIILGIPMALFGLFALFTFTVAGIMAIGTSAALVIGG